MPGEELLASALLKEAPAIAEGGMGIYQAILANQLRKKYQRPELKTPEAFDTALKNIEALSLGTSLPGQSIAEEKIGATTQAGVKSAQESGQSSSGILNAISKMYGQEQGQQADLAVKGAEYHTERQAALAGMLEKKAGLEQKEWEYNKQQPYEAAMSAAKELSTASQSNIMDMMKTTGRIGGDYMKAKNKNEVSGIDTSPLGKIKEKLYNGENLSSDELSLLFTQQR